MNRDRFVRDHECGNMGYMDGIVRHSPPPPIELALPRDGEE
jgi:hypothetical protein